MHVCVYIYIYIYTHIDVYTHVMRVMCVVYMWRAYVENRGSLTDSGSSKRERQACQEGRNSPPGEEPPRLTVRAEV